MIVLKKLVVQEHAVPKDYGINMCNWIPMTDEDWDWVNYGKLPQK